MPQLHGVGVLVTRPEQQAMPLCLLFEMQGASTLRFPAVEISAIGNRREMAARLGTLVIHAEAAYPGLALSLDHPALGQVVADALALAALACAPSLVVLSLSPLVGQTYPAATLKALGLQKGKTK